MLWAIPLAAVVLLVGVSVGFPGNLGDGTEPGPPPPRQNEPEVLGVAKAKASTSRKGPKRNASKQVDRFALQPESEPLPITNEFDESPRAGLVFDVDTGEILWERHADRELPIASLTKMMTAYLIATSHKPDEMVKIPASATRAGGSMVGVLPAGEKVKLGALLKGLLLVSGNDAAEALAEHDAGSVKKFVGRMNAEAERLGLECTRFTTPHGLEDKGNHSCPRDLAELARADLSAGRIADIAATDHESISFPIPGGMLELYNNNPFIRAGDPTITGLKTGYTDAAGRCYVTTAERGGRHYGVVLLDSPDPLTQVPKLLELAEKQG